MVSVKKKRDDKSRVDRWIEYAKNHKFISIIVFCAIVLIGIGSLSDALSSIYKLASGNKSAEETEYVDSSGADPELSKSDADQTVIVSEESDLSTSAYGISAGDWISGVPVESGSTFRDLLDTPLMVVIPSGKFQRGSPPSEDGSGPGERPVGGVHIVNPFGLGKYEVTVGEWRIFIDATNYSLSGNCC